MANCGTSIDLFHCVVFDKMFHCVVFFLYSEQKDALVISVICLNFGPLLISHLALPHFVYFCMQGVLIILQKLL
jgi:hypothetical protein